MINLRVENNQIIVSNLYLFEGSPVKTNLTADVTSGTASLTVANIAGFAINKILYIGNPGDTTSEIIKTHSTTAPTGTTITLASNLVFDHPLDTPVYIIQYDQIEFHKASILAGSKTQLPVAGATAYAIRANSLESVYTIASTDLVTSTTYLFTRFKDTINTLYSSYSTGVVYTGLTGVSAQQIVEEGCSLAGVEVGDDYAKETQLLRDANEAQDFIREFGDWDFELIKNDTSITSTENENKYILSGLTYELKYSNTNQGIKSVRFGNTKLDYLDMAEMDEEFEDVAEGTLSVTAAVGATSITLSDSYEFAESGVIYLGSNVVTYTANAQATGVLSGISASDITVEVTSGATVWQGVQPAKPTKYSIFNGYLYVDKPIDTDYAGIKFKVKYLKKLTAFTDFASVTEIPFYQALSKYVAYKIFSRMRDKEQSDQKYREFTDMVTINFNRRKLPVMDTQTYYNFRFTGNSDRYTDSSEVV